MSIFPITPTQIGIYFIHFLIITGLIFLFWNKAKTSNLRVYFGLGLTFKILAGWTLGAIYLHFYSYPNPNYPISERLFFSGDTWSYFAHGQMVIELAKRDFETYFNWLLQKDYHIYEYILRSGYDTNSRAVFMYRITHIFNFLTNNNYWLISIYFSLFSFFGLWKCANTLAKIFPKTKEALALSFFFVPSVVFWSSSILKETILVGCLGLVLAIFFHLTHKLFLTQKHRLLLLFEQLISIFILLILLWVIFKIKYYYFAVLLPTLFAYALTHEIKQRFLVNSYFQIFMFLGIFGMLLGVASQIHPNLHLSRFLEVVVKNNAFLMELSKAENIISYSKLKPDIQSFIKNTPHAFIGAFLRPFPWESGGLLKLPIRLENLFLYGLIFMNIGLFLKKRKWNLKNKLLLLTATFTFIFVLGILMALATPNIGTLIRYKVGFFPFLVYILSIKPIEWLKFQLFQER